MGNFKIRQDKPLVLIAPPVKNVPTKMDRVLWIVLSASILTLEIMNATPVTLATSPQPKERLIVTLVMPERLVPTLTEVLKKLAQLQNIHKPAKRLVLRALLVMSVLLLTWPEPHASRESTPTQVRWIALLVPRVNIVLSTVRYRLIVLMVTMQRLRRASYVPLVLQGNSVTQQTKPLWELTVTVGPTLAKLRLLAQTVQLGTNALTRINPPWFVNPGLIRIVKSKQLVETALQERVVPIRRSLQWIVGQLNMP
mmetsp:Transcript_40965/g.47131  ORF Transcript_40965/g.47131 Transcript_40965/m.47131 type:complete len:254 (-) Transcript_40965:1290-2051(-)